MFSDYGVRALQFDTTSAERAEVFKEIVVAKKGHSFWASHVRPHKEQVCILLYCAVFCCILTRGFHDLWQILRQFKKKVQNDSQAHRKTAAIGVNKVFCSELDIK